MSVRFAVAVAGLASVLVGNPGGRVEAGAGGELDVIVERYASWRQISPEGYSPPPAVGRACFKPLHVPGPSRVYTSPGLDPTAPGDLPPGSVVVKEKGGAESPALGIMIKRAAGFSPGGGDWEYVVMGGEPLEVRDRGALARCQSCHNLADETDHLFVPYLERR